MCTWRNLKEFVCVYPVCLQKSNFHIGDNPSKAQKFVLLVPNADLLWTDSGVPIILWCQTWSGTAQHSLLDCIQFHTDRDFLGLEQKQLNITAMCISRTRNSKYIFWNGLHIFKSTKKHGSDLSKFIFGSTVFFISKLFFFFLNMDIISKAANKKMVFTHVPTCNFHMQLVRYLSDVAECQGLTKNRFMWIFYFLWLWL